MNRLRVPGLGNGNLEKGDKVEEVEESSFIRPPTPTKWQRFWYLNKKYWWGHVIFLLLSTLILTTAM
jgi:hypothetical protein